jgi:hypothetical protein
MVFLFGYGTYFFNNFWTYLNTQKQCLNIKLHLNLLQYLNWLQYIINNNFNCWKYRIYSRESKTVSLTWSVYSSSLLVLGSLQPLPSLHGMHIFIYMFFLSAAEYFSYSRIRIYAFIKAKLRRWCRKRNTFICSMQLLLIQILRFLMILQYIQKIEYKNVQTLQKSLKLLL